MTGLGNIWFGQHSLWPLWGGTWIREQWQQYQEMTS
jgi:hypothetical protein